MWITKMKDLTPLETLYEWRQDDAIDLPLPAELKNFYGGLRFPQHLQRPYVIGNFVTTLDGVASLNIPGHSAGGDISGFNTEDRIVMGLLRAVSDAVIVGAGTLRSVPDHLWTASYIYPDLTYIYEELRTTLGKTEPPLNVIVTSSGEIDLQLRVFQAGEVPVLIVTTPAGANQLYKHQISPTVSIVVAQTTTKLSAAAILEAVVQHRPGDVILVEGGPALMADFFAEKYIDELFLTFAPQLAGRDRSIERPGFVSGKMFAPEEPIWSQLAGVKRSGSHLFLRYMFESKSISGAHYEK
jgi:riboflavin biosynthesis pyrimidine reductase